MHEGAIAQSLIMLAEESVRPFGSVAVSRVGVLIGELAGVAPESLRFCFDCLKENSRLAHTELVIEWRSRYGCDCSSVTPVETWEPNVCPRCGAPINLPAAEVLKLQYVDWDEEAQS
jgi:hydrogenase nickel incorporation protein HypA/HybF